MKTSGTALLNWFKFNCYSSIPNYKITKNILKMYKVVVDKLDYVTRTILFILLNFTSTTKDLNMATFKSLLNSSCQLLIVRISLYF